jgi:uncharacterized protein (DUF2235 family)
MPRNLIICCDGTNNQFGVDANTNVVRLVETSVNDPKKQLIYYDPGVGTLPEPTLWTKAGQTLNRWWSLAFGTGLVRNIEEAYLFLMNHWKPGDRVFLFGFSRGAYSVRVLAGLLHQFGLLPQGNDNLIPYVVRMYGGLRTGIFTGKTNKDYWKLANKFRGAFARTLPSSRGKRFPIHFLGVWDTVSSVGYIWNPKTYPFTSNNPSVRHARHAISIDERRWFFRQNQFTRSVANQDLIERWFPGAHADVGGGYREAEGGLWRVAFEWMLEEAKAKGLLVDETKLEQVFARSQLQGDIWKEPAHESLIWKWWIAEMVPKLVFQGKGKWRRVRIGGWGFRSIPNGAMISEPALRRIRENSLSYSPPNMTGDFLRAVRALPTVQGDLPYRPQGDFRIPGTTTTFPVTLDPPGSQGTAP